MTNILNIIAIYNKHKDFKAMLNKTDKKLLPFEIPNYLFYGSSGKQNQQLILDKLKELNMTLVVIDDKCYLAQS